MLIVGESINGTIEKVGRAILDRDKAFLGELARLQVESGAEAIDVNAGVAGGNESEDLPWLVRIVQKEVSVPLMMDSANPEALEAALSVYQGKEPPLLNSISGEEHKWRKLFPLLTKRDCKIVVLCMDDRGIPKTPAERVAVATELFHRLTEGGLPPDFIYFDPLVLSVAVDPEAPLITLETIRMLRSSFPSSHVICGLSNVSLGLPGRRLINRTFLAMAIGSGLDTLLVDVRDQALFSLIQAAKVLTGEDPYCLNYIQAYRGKRLWV